jgi:hypothetical protein
LGSAARVRQKSEVANPDEVFGQHVEEETPQEFRSQKRHLPQFAPVGVVFPPEGHAFAVKRQEPMVGNGNPMGVSAQVTQHLRGAAKGGFGINRPVLPMQSS